MLQALLHSVPEEFHPRLKSAWDEFSSAAAAHHQSTHALHPALVHTLAKVWCCSPFVARLCCRRPDWLFDPAFIERCLAPTDLAGYAALLDSELKNVRSEADLLKSLRVFRNREMLRLAWRDIACWAPIDDILKETTVLAEALVQASLAVLFDEARERYGVPTSDGESAQPLTVLAMGKMGAWELNFSSDIDLIFCYRAEGTLSGRREMTFHEFYTRLAHRLIQVLDRVTEDGFVFRVDMRLRPFGDSGPLVLNYDAMERYYLGQARDWERYAMVKARPIAGDARAVEEIEALRRPFVYRRYLDYRAFGELRELKDKITRDLKANERLENVKLGLGGIREIEFIAQVFQLIRGGRDPALRERRVLVVLDVLGSLGHLPRAVVAKLAEAYRFLRRVENRLQQYEDQQTHELPTTAIQQAALALAMGFSAWPALKRRIDEVQRAVHEVFEQIMAAPHAEAASRDFLHSEDLSSPASLEQFGFKNPHRALSLLNAFKASTPIRKLSSRGVSELDRLLPLLLRRVAGLSEADLALERVLGLLEAIASRNVYFSLLNENPLALTQLVKLASASAWICHYLSQFPILLDELMDPRALYRPLTRDELSQQLDQRLSSIDNADLEQVMVGLGQFKQANVLRVAATDIMGIAPLMVVSDHLTYIAETVVGAVLRLSWGLTASRHGPPPGASAEKPSGFAVIAYGKLGGIELGYGSDLDLVFLHEDVPPSAMTGGEGSQTAVEFFARVARRMISLITTRTHAGTLYDIDLRLRPSGNSGLLVSSLEAYEAYQLNSAWTWEQQSLVRARFIAGDQEVGERFAAIRERSLTRVRGWETLRTEVTAMREKMREQLAGKDAAQFDLKQGRGGIADIEFIVQFLVLANASLHPRLTRWTDVIRLLAELRDVGAVSPEDAEDLRQAYCSYREAVHRSALQERQAMVSNADANECRGRVQNIWKRIMLD